MSRVIQSSIGSCKKKERKKKKKKLKIFHLQVVGFGIKHGDDKVWYTTYYHTHFYFFFFFFYTINHNKNNGRKHREKMSVK